MGAFAVHSKDAAHDLQLYLRKRNATIGKRTSGYADLQSATTLRNSQNALFARSKILRNIRNPESELSTAMNNCAVQVHFGRKKTMRKLQTSIKRRDATGHLNPKYERELLEESSGNKEDHRSVSAFISRPRTGDELGEELGESFAESATSGEGAGTERHDRVIPEEQGGPFVRSSSAIEFAGGTDASNIAGAMREPFPRTSKA